MKKIIIRIICVLFFVLTISACSVFDDVIKRKKWNSTLLFNKDNIKIKKISYVDLIGLSIHGECFDYYKYEIKNINDWNCDNDFPNFNMMFDTTLLQNISYLHWQKTPIINDKDFESLSFIIYSSNFSKNEITKDFLERNLFNEEGNYYCYFGAYPIGIYIFIFSPKDDVLHIIVKK